ncbi:Putative ribonuclease H protein At1g65750 [Linum perenne]
MSPPINYIGEDSLVWGLEPNGIFSVRSAFSMLQELDDTASDPFWSSLWKWHGPNKINHFLWLATHYRLLTNEERNRRHLTNQVLCPRCSLQPESLSHVLVDCHFATQVWQNVLPLAVSTRHDGRDFISWWKSMLKDKNVL